MTALEPCCSTCLGCGLTYCREVEVSPGEVDGICPSCYETEDAA